MGAAAVRLVVAAFHRHLEDFVGVRVVRLVYHHAGGGGGQVAFAQGACGVGRLGRVLEVAQIVEDARIKRKGKGDKTALQAIRQKKADYIKARSKAIEETGTSLRTKKAYASWLDSRPGNVEKGLKDYIDPSLCCRSGDSTSRLSKWRSAC